MKIKKFFIRSYYFVVNPFRKLYWFLFRPQVRGVKSLIQFENKFLLVKLAYAHKQWGIPGGGVDAKETFRDAVMRETFEEVGVSLQNPQKIGSYFSDVDFRQVTVEVFHTMVDNNFFEIDPIEITEAGWFAPDEVPLDTSPRTYALFKMLRENNLNLLNNQKHG
jgi:ADP-ribose pyrophosphatase YjhB (NUDIX family)